MKFTVYIIKSVNYDFIYKGMTSDLVKRIEQHNSGKAKSTKPYKPFILLYKEEFTDMASARIREKQLKSGWGREFIASINN